MTIPLIALAILAVVGGWFGIPHVLGEVIPGHPDNALDRWFEGIILKPSAEHGGHGSSSTELALMGLSVSVAMGSAFLAYLFYVVNPSISKKLGETFKLLHEVVYKKYFVDEIYFGLIINPLIDISKAIWAYIDVGFIDRATFVVSDVVKGTGSSVRTLQSGNMQQYAMYFVLGMVGLLMFLIK
jgi:NADH-quinone oxidoreductase subunit L